MTPAELLRAAAARITAETWCQHDLADGYGRFCAVGHIQQIGACPTESYYIALSALRTMVGSVDRWNDRHDMTALRIRAGLVATADAIDDGTLGDIVEVGVAS